MRGDEKGGDEPEEAVLSVMAGGSNRLQCTVRARKNDIPFALDLSILTEAWTCLANTSACCVFCETVLCCRAF